MDQQSRRVRLKPWLVAQAWAVETGKFQAGVDSPDPARWKANLRCALNKSREFHLKYDGTKETPPQMFKVYEVCEQLAAADDDESNAIDERLSPTLQNLMELTIDSRSSDHPSFTTPFTLSTNGTFGPLHPTTSDLPHSQNRPPDQLTVTYPTPPAPMTEDQDRVQNQGEQNCDLLSSIPLTDLDVKVLYRGRAVECVTVSNPHGCRLFYGHLEPSPQQVDLFGPVTLQQVRFPGTSSIQNQKQRDYTEALLDVMDRGLILEMWEQDIYAVRLCQCKVFWSGPGLEEAGCPNPLEREKKIKVFSLNDFLQGLISFQKGDAPTPPPFDIFFCFGEDWPDYKPKEKKLIVVQVVPVVARILTEMFSGELSWSTDSIRLQISHPDLKDQTVEQFKELQRLLQSQQNPGPWTSSGP